MSNKSITIRVASKKQGSAARAIRNASVILYNKDMTIRSVGFTLHQGEFHFLNVPQGEFVIMVLDGPNRRFQLIDVAVAQFDVSTNITLLDVPGRKGQIIVKVVVGGSTKSNRTVKLFVGTTLVGSSETDTDGKVVFDGLNGTYAVELVSSDPRPACKGRIGGISVGPSSSSTSEVEINVLEGC